MLNKNVEWTLKQVLKDYRENDFVNNLNIFMKNNNRCDYAIKNKKMTWQDIAQIVTVLSLHLNHLGRGLGGMFGIQGTSTL